MPLKIRYSNYGLECGTDEAGRGCLAGPVTAAAVILPLSFNNSSLNDSKQISEKNVLYEDIFLCGKSTLYHYTHN